MKGDNNKTNAGDVEYVRRYMFHNHGRPNHNKLLAVVLLSYIFTSFVWFFAMEKIIGSNILSLKSNLLLDKIEYFGFVGLSALIICIIKYHVLSKIRKSDEELLRSYVELIETQERLQLLNEELGINNKKLADIEERFTLATNGANDVIWDSNLITKDIFFSDKWYELLGYERDELNINFDSWQGLLHPEDVERVAKHRTEHLSGKTNVYCCEYRLKDKNGEYRWILARGRALFNNEGQAVRFAGSLSDISRVKRYGEKLHYLAYNDPLTGLFNRTCATEKLKHKLENNVAGTIFYLDVDEFDTVNDIFGHAIGDKVLIEISRRLSELAFGIGEVFRVNSDKFAIITYNKFIQNEAEAFAQKIMDLITKSFTIKDKNIDITTCIAISMLPDNGHSVEEIFNNTHIAMHTAKKIGAGSCTLYNKTMYESLIEKRIMEDNLRKAINNNELELYYQPQVDLKSQKVLSLEALLRWNSEELGSISPDKFIPIAEESKLIIPLGSWVINNVCLFIKKLHVEGFCHLTVSVNVSVIQLTQDNFVGNLIRCLEEHDLEPCYLEIEITESVFMESYNEISGNILRLIELGVKIALDDFGKGYSSLGRLAHLPITTLKIDKCFIDGISSGDNSIILTGSIINIGHSLGLEVIAEGVENEEQLAYLREHKCDKIQGYIYSRPLPEDEIIEQIESISFELEEAAS